jgi:hypothetical protein
MIYVYLVCDFQLYCIPNDVYRPFRCRVYTNKAIDILKTKLEKNDRSIGTLARIATLVIGGRLLTGL